MSQKQFSLFAVVVFGASAGLSLAMVLPVSISGFAGTLGLIAVLLPPLALACEQPIRRLVIFGALVDGVAAGWLATVATPDVTLVHWLECYVILISAAAAVMGLALASWRVTKSEVTGAMIAVVLALAWLLFPIWLSPLLKSSSTWISYLITPHPIFALNRALPRLELWTHSPLMYRLTNLGQDVPYSLPASIWPAVLLHAVIAAPLIWFGWKNRRGSPAVDALSDPQTRSTSPQGR
jgi:hypothetical protein